MIITIDGPAASGKGTLARRLGRHYGYYHLDTGLLYRSFAFFLQRTGLGVCEALVRFDLNDVPMESGSDAHLRTDHVGRLASHVAADPAVRARLLKVQRSVVREKVEGGVVLDGRDTGTVVCPEAEVKFFLLAGVRERARRRTCECGSEEADLEEVLAHIEARDRRDSEREHAPLSAPPGAAIIDTTQMTIDQVFLTACRVVDRLAHG